MDCLERQYKVGFLILSLLNLQVMWSFSSCPADQTSALLHFKSLMSINSSASVGDCDLDAGVVSYPKTDTWKEGTDCCSWDGVICDELTGNVIGLDLSCSWLFGKIPANTSLPVLTHLQRVNLAHNHFHGSEIPSEFGQLVSLTYLNLSYSMFSGIIPSEISHLSKLVMLDLSRNFGLELDNYTFGVLSKNLTELAYLFLEEVNMSLIAPSTLLNLSASLVSISLFNCQLQGEFPPNIFNLPFLKELRISVNKGLVGALPKSNWSSPLELLDLSETSFSGELPNSIRNLMSLKELNLKDCIFSGSIPYSLWNLTQITFLDMSSNGFIGQIPSSLRNLRQLTWLDLSLNLFEGQIPNVFDNLSKSVYLSFVNNNFSGILPMSLFNLPKLSILDLSGNKLEGGLPRNIDGLSELIGLYLSGNKLTGTIPAWLFSLPLLEELRLSGNRFTGQVLEFQSRSLKYIYLDKNMLQGHIPESIFELANLTDLFLSSNNFIGIVELDKFSRLRSLLRLDLSHTNLQINATSGVNSTWPKITLLMLSSCNISDFPSFLRMQDGLEYLDLSNNNIHGKIPTWLSNVGENSLLLLNLSNNLLTEVEQLAWRKLKALDLHSNMLHGLLPIPPPEVTFFSVSNNKLSGEISSMICNASSLQILDLSHNNLNGMIPPCLGNLSKSLSVLNLGTNTFHGTIPETFVAECSLRNFNLQGNQLEGSLPKSLVSCRQLEVLDFGNNMFDGTFPSWLGSLPELQVLALRSNKFYGTLSDLTAIASFSKLLVLDLSNNNFIGPLPTTYIQSFKAMINGSDARSRRMYLGETNHSYDYTVTVTVKGFEIEMQKIFYIFSSIDLSRNKFEGVIPEDIGTLRSVRGLNLSHNRFTGSIPSTIGSMSGLEWLDLSSNKLVGEIPKQLADLSSLAILNLSDNQLVGNIPQGKQFSTFDADSYEGNLGLCGFPLSSICEDEETELPPPPDAREEDNPSFFESGFGWKAILTGYGCGVVFSVAMCYIMFQTGKPEWLLVIINKKKSGKIAGWSRSSN